MTRRSLKFTLCHGIGVFALVFLANSAWSAENNERTKWQKYEAKGKVWLQKRVALPLVEAHKDNSPVFTWAAGWDFTDHRWKLNEFTNQTAHMMVGGITNRLVGRHFTLCLAGGLELGQYFGHDHHALKLPDRLRDVCFYLLS